MPPSSASLRGSNYTTLVSSGSQTITLPVTTNAGDFIVVSVGSSNDNFYTNNVSVSGAGATWSAYNLNSSGNGFGAYLGYAATAGQTSVTLSNVPSNTGGNVLCAVYSGLAQDSSGTLATSFTSAGNPTATTAQFASIPASGALLLGVAQSYGFAASPQGSWSNGFTDTFVVGGTRVLAVTLDYANAGGSANTAFTSPAGSGSNTVVAIAFAIPIGTFTGTGSTAASFSPAGSASVIWPGSGSTAASFTSSGSAVPVWAATGLTGVAFTSTGSANYRFPATGSTSAAFVALAHASVDYFVSGATYVAFSATGAGSVRYSHPGTVRGGVAISSVAGGYETGIVVGSFAVPGLEADIEVLNGHYLL